MTGTVYFVNGVGIDVAGMGFRRSVGESAFLA